MKFLWLFLAFMVHGCACSGVLAQSVGKQLEFNSAMGVQYESNLVKNPSAYKNDLYKTVSSATATRDTDAADQIDGKASWIVDASMQNGYFEPTLLTPSSEQTSGNCGFSGVFKGNGSLYRAQILDGSNNVLAQTLTFTNETGWREFKVWHPCGASGARKVRITQTEAGTAPAINVGRLFYGRMEPGAGVPENEFSATFTGTGIITRKSDPSNHLGSASISDTSLFDIALNGLTSIPICRVTPVITGFDTAQVSALLEGALSSISLKIRTGYQASGGAFTKNAYGFTVACTKTGSDYIQPAITGNQFNYPPTPYTPSVTFGSGGATNYTLDFTHERKGKNIIIKGRASFSAASASFSGFRISLPPGVIIDSTTAPGLSGSGFARLVIAGNALAGRTVAVNTTTIETQTLTTGTGSNPVSVSVSPVTQAGIVSNDFIGFDFEAPVVGWTETQNAPQLIGSVTSNSTNAERMERARFSCQTSSVVNNQSTGFIASIGNAVDAGTYRTCTVAFNTPFASQPECPASTVLGTGTLPSGYTVALLNITTSGFTLVGPDSDFFASVVCMGPR